jgi:hypothetical protein
MSQQQILPKKILINNFPTLLLLQQDMSFSSHSYLVYNTAIWCTWCMNLSQTAMQILGACAMETAHVAAKVVVAFMWPSSNCGIILPLNEVASHLIIKASN